MTSNYTWRNFLNRCCQFCINRTFTINWLPQCIYYTTHQFAANRHFQDAASTFNLISFFDVLIFTQHNSTNRIALQVHCQTKRIIRKFKHFTLHYV